MEQLITSGSQELLDWGRSIERIVESVQKAIDILDRLAREPVSLKMYMTRKTYLAISRAMHMRPVTYTTQHQQKHHRHKRAMRLRRY